MYTNVFHKHKPIFIISTEFFLCTIKPVDKGHSREPENVVFMSSWPYCTG